MINIPPSSNTDVSNTPGSKDSINASTGETITSDEVVITIKKESIYIPVTSKACEKRPRSKSAKFFAMWTKEEIKKYLMEARKAQKDIDDRNVKRLEEKKRYSKFLIDIISLI